MNCEYILRLKLPNGEVRTEGPFHAPTPGEASERARDQVKKIQEGLLNTDGVVTAQLFRGFEEIDGFELLKLDRNPDSIHW